MRSPKALTASTGDPEAICQPGTAVEASGLSPPAKSSNRTSTLRTGEVTVAPEGPAAQ